MPTCRRLVCAVAAALIASSAVHAESQVSYTGSVLYPLIAPSGYQINQVGLLQDGSQGAAGGQVVGAGSPLPGGNGDNQPLLWTAPSGSVVQLDPNEPSFVNSHATSTDGIQQVGWVGIPSHAFLWSGTAESAVDLNPTNIAGITYSQAFGIGGGQQVGYGYGSGTNNTEHAFLWSGTAASAVDLNPAGAGGSDAFGTDGVQQVGYGTIDGTDASHAFLWSGTAASAVDLNPNNIAGFNTSEALGVSNGQEVGYVSGDYTGPGHAVVWEGTAASAVDLNPTKFGNSEAISTNGAEQVGWANGIGPYDNAYLWFGTAASGVDLQSILPSTIAWNFSIAYSIDSSGNIYGVADAPPLNGGTQEIDYAVEWSPVPEPGSLTLLAAGAAGLLARRRRKPRAVC
jgi:hypothetical protein